jgi:putative peptide zinc metalloprotease protein
VITDDATRDLLHSRLRLSDDIAVRPERVGDSVWYHLEHRPSGRFFRIGHAEYTFISLLDGETTPAAALGLTARVLGPAAFTAEQATRLLSWLLDNDLAITTDVGNLRRGASNHEQRQSRKLIERLNPLSFKLPLGNPDRLAEQLTRGLGWIHSLPAMLLAMGLAITGLISLLSQWAEFQHSARTIFAPDNWLWLTLTWIGLKVVHEASHAVACKRLGGRVSETGLIFILLAPVAYVDVTASLRFPSKWQRIQVAFAGMYAELILASVALLIWSRTDSDSLRHLLYNVIVMASLSTLLFNANPLMKFDGYFILSDLLEIPNLASRGNDIWSAILRRVWLGQRTAIRSETGLQRGLIAAYGLAAFLWRLVVVSGLLITATTLWHGLGIAIAVVGCTIWFGRSIATFTLAALHVLRHAPGQFIRAVVVSGIWGTTSAALLLLTPWPFASTAPGFVEHRDLAVIRAGSAGFVRIVHVADGQSVQAGKVLIELENVELATEVNDLLAAIDQADLRYNKHLKAQQHAEAQLETLNRAALEKRLLEKRRQFEALTVRAPIAGRVMSRSLALMKDTYAREGDELLTVGNEAQKEFWLSVAQSDAAQLTVDAPVSVRLHSSDRLKGHVRQITPQASQVPPHAALTVMAGGPLAVRPLADSKSSDQANQLDFEFLEPRITVRVALDEATSSELTAGVTGRAALPDKLYDNLFAGFYFTTHDWLRDKLAAATQDARKQ